MVEAWKPRIAICQYVYVLSHHTSQLMKTRRRRLCHRVCLCPPRSSVESLSLLRIHVAPLVVQQGKNVPQTPRLFVAVLHIGAENSGARVGTVNGWLLSEISEYLSSGVNDQTEPDSPTAAA